MPTDEDPNVSSPSTTWTWRKVRITQAPQANVSGSVSDSSLKSLLPWPARRPVNITLKYRGGPECWVEIKARGRTIRRPGYTQLVDLLQEIMQRPL